MAITDPSLSVSGPASPSDATLTAVIRRRRLLVLALNTGTVLALLAAMARLLAFNGVSPLEGAMLVVYALTLPWLSIGFWNAIIGLYLDLRHKDAAGHVTPQLRRTDPDAPITLRCAIIMPLRNESADGALSRFEAVQRDLARTPWAGQFEFHVLSDTNLPAIAAAERQRVDIWRTRAPGARIVYRQRLDNSGYKAGNIAEFLSRCGDDHDLFLPLDADSVMSASAVLRLVRVMEANPELGLLQGLVVGRPAQSFFTRAFQFGMRHGMRSFTLGSAWWQADCGPYWGHNAVVRTAPFRDNCMLPVLPGKGPLSGHILSHDQVEAALLRRAGYEVRVLAEEDESYEENPPSLTDFILRELRWCNGNFQYFRLLATPGLMPVSRLQLVLAILMYLTAPAWMAFILMGAILAGGSGQLAGVPIGYGLALFAAIMTLNLFPKIMGLAQVWLNPDEARRYGGRRRVVTSGLLELALSMLTAPAVAFSISIFAVGLLFGRRIQWRAQTRERHRLGWDEATRMLWPQTITGTGLSLYLASTAPWAMIFGAPVLLALTFAIPIAVLTTLPTWGAWSIRNGIFDIPEDDHRDRDETRPEILKAA
ncbi:glucans biosynthesis glucosyltransferase MdoH [Meridianimarinicoccus sp. MJW13]|uniref:glucans biosynthesis glucosyltransferase MdoH n=1 Tax=Meridianimarinicoccus sp. MJW13 TaxID=2720031 RepID=UPI001D01495C|nr:glucans biosynthesis glucosyltransferase MdoH [Fluviibacterium sp. MJW13]